MEEEVAKIIVQLLADENHKLMRPHAGGMVILSGQLCKKLNFPQLKAPIFLSSSYSLCAFASHDGLI